MSGERPRTGSFSLGEAEPSVLFKSASEACREGLFQVEERIISRLNSDAPQLSDIARYLLALGGKRIRPITALLSARLFGMAEPSPELVDAAAGIELIHMATLLHDDIIDESPTRRHRESAFSRFGSTPTLLAGDFLLVKAFGLCAHLDDYVVEATERACIELTEGELLEGKLLPTAAASLDFYLNIVSKKTASLFELASGIGAYLAGAAPDSVGHMKGFGRNAGIAFQMIDDILDITSTEEVLGKPPGTDLRQKTPSLVNVLWLKEGGDEARKFFTAEPVSPDAAERALELLRRSPLIDECRRTARIYAERALAELDQAGSPQDAIDSKRLLEALVIFTLERCL